LRPVGTAVLVDQPFAFGVEEFTGHRGGLFVVFGTGRERPLA
jgi:hypothetical protein